MVTTLSLFGYHLMKKHPELKDIPNLDLEMFAADLSLLLKYRDILNIQRQLLLVM